MIRAAGVLAALPAVALASALHAQATGPEANLVFGLAASHYSGRTSLWFSPRQPLPYLLADPEMAEPDTVAVGRDVDGGLGLMFYGMYFPSNVFGFSGEVHFLGTEYEDRCTPVFLNQPLDPDEGPNPNGLACGDIEGRTQSTSTVLANVGAIARAWSREQFSPYLRLGGGLGIVNRSAIDMVTSRGNTLIRVYDTGEGASVTFSAVAGAGFTFRLGRGGYQIRTEVRDTYVGYRAVTATTPATVVAPPTELRYRHLFSVVLGFEIVLERSRGRRY